MHTPKVGTSWYVPPSGIYNTHAPVCVCVPFLDGYDANMPINIKLCCVLFNELRWPKHDHRLDFFSKVTCNAVHILKYYERGNFFTSTMAHPAVEKSSLLHGLAIQKVLKNLRRLSNVFPGRWRGKNIIFAQSHLGSSNESTVFMQVDQPVGYGLKAKVWSVIKVRINKWTKQEKKCGKCTVHFSRLQ